jgi:hypothetical protein
VIVTRRNFMGTILALGCAPAIVRASSLMKIIVPSPELIVPTVEIWQAPFLTMEDFIQRQCLD